MEDFFDSGEHFCLQVCMKKYIDEFDVPSRAKETHGAHSNKTEVPFTGICVVLAINVTLDIASIYSFFFVNFL